MESSIKKIIQDLEENERKIEELKQENAKIRLSCNHEFVLCLGKYSMFDILPFPYCKCLCCKRSFRLGAPKEEDIDINSIIDIRDKISEDDILTMQRNEPVLVIQGHNKLKEILENNPELSKEEIKEIILEDLLSNHNLIDNEQGARSLNLK